MALKIHEISAGHLTLNKVSEIIRLGYKLQLGEDSRQKILRCREYLDQKIADTKDPIYGVTTGFGSLCNINIDKDQLSQLQINLMMSHACGCGERVPNDIVKLMILLKIQSLSYGYSGVQLHTVERLIDFFNDDIFPIVYMQGSVGSSGDLVPLAHLCLPLVGLGEVEYQGRRQPSAAGRSSTPHNSATGPTTSEPSRSMPTMDVSSPSIMPSMQCVLTRDRWTPPKTSATFSKEANSSSSPRSMCRTPIPSVAFHRYMVL